MKKTLADFRPLKPAEAKLLECCQSGDIAVIGKERPTEKTKENEIRADFIRFLALTKDITLASNGVQFRGAWISGILNLERCDRKITFYILVSVFDELILLSFASLFQLNLQGSLLEKGLNASGLRCAQHLFLREDFISKAEVCLSGAEIVGDFDCSNSEFFSKENQGYALNCDSMRISEGFVVRNEFNKICRIYGHLIMTNVHVEELVDNNQFWEQSTLKSIKFDGFKYKHIYGDTTALFRLNNMLNKLQYFSPQPYKQLAIVLRDMGHDRDADEVMIALHDKRLELSKESKWYKAFRKLYKWTSEYGYRPMRTLKIMASVWFLFGCIYWYGANVAVFAPSNPLIFQKDYNCAIDKNGTKWLAFPKDYNESNNWYIASPAEYTTFQPFWYSLDIILPVVDLKMENDWGIVIPSPEGSWSDMIPFTTTNHFIRFLTWVETLAGWGLSLMLVAILSGLAKNEKE